MAPGGGVPPCDRVCSRPLESNTLFFLAPCAEPELLTRLRLLITSVFRLIGRGLPWSLRNRPQALQSTEPISSRRQRGVVEVVQFWHVGGELLWPPPVVAEGEDVEKPIGLGTLNALNCGELFVDARDARAERPGSCGSEALWCNVEFCVEVEEGREMGSIVGSDCRPSSKVFAILKEGRSRASSLEAGWMWSMAEAL